VTLSPRREDAEPHGPWSAVPVEAQRPLAGLDGRVEGLVRLAALVSSRAPAAAYRDVVAAAMAAGATADDVVATLRAVAPGVGLARVVAAVPGLALAAGYDVDAALESLDEG
jgi:4-carboxymuconolactone decarboxylase